MEGDGATEQLTVRAAELGDWRGEALLRVHRLIEQAEPGATLAWRWVKPSNPGGVAVWEHAGGICTGETYRDKVKLTFHRGASLDDPAGLFNSGLDGKARRAIDLREGDALDEGAFVALVRAAVAANTAR